MLWRDDAVDKRLSLCVNVNAVLMVLLSFYAFLIPAAALVCDLNDPGLRSNEMPRCAFRWHRALSPKYEKWARERVACGAATKLATGDVSGTEWPVLWLGVLSLGDGSIAGGVP